MAKKRKREYRLDDLVEMASQLGCRVRLEMLPMEMPPKASAQPAITPPKKAKP